MLLLLIWIDPSSGRLKILTCATVLLFLSRHATWLRLPSTEPTISRIHTWSTVYAAAVRWRSSAKWTSRHLLLLRLGASYRSRATMRCLLLHWRLLSNSSIARREASRSPGSALWLYLRRWHTIVLVLVVAWLHPIVHRVLVRRWMSAVHGRLLLVHWWRSPKTTRLVWRHCTLSIVGRHSTHALAWNRVSVLVYGRWRRHSRAHALATCSIVTLSAVVATLRSRRRILLLVLVV